MKGFTLIYSDSVKKTIKKIPKDRQKQIIEKLDLLPIDPKLLDIVKITGRENTYRARIGSYRAIFVVDFKGKLIKIDHLETRGKIEKYY